MTALLDKDPVKEAGSRRAAMKSKYYRNWHLANDETEFKVTEMEFALMRVIEAFARWVAAADEMVGLSELKHAEHVILHVIRMQNRPKSGATIARLLNRDDLPNIQYSLRKLESSGLIHKNKEAGTKNHTYSITKLGEKLTNEYSKLRTEILIRKLQPDRLRRTGRGRHRTAFDHHRHLRGIGADLGHAQPRQRRLGGNA